MCVYLFPLRHIGCIRVMMKGGKQWELQVDHSLFAITKLDLTVSHVVINAASDILFA